MFASDNHGDERDLEACKRVIEFRKQFKPDYAIHGGDCFDFRWLRKSASKDEQEGRITDDLDAGIEFLAAYKPTHFLWGNHDQRILDKCETTDGKFKALCEFVLERIEVCLQGVAQVRPYGKRQLLEIDDWKFGHGWGSGINAVRDHALRYGQICVGHLHRVERVQAARFDGATGLCAGCLCKRELSYNRAQLNTLAQSNGFVYGERVNGRWILQQEVIA